MGSYIARRTLAAAISLAGVSLMTFLLVFLVPGDPAEMVAQARFGHGVVEWEIEMVRRTEGLDRPLAVQYLKWVSHLLQLDLGHSLINRQPVMSLICSRLPATLLLACSSLLLSLLAGVPAGVIAAVKKGTRLDSVLRIIALAGVSVPGFWLSYLLIIVFALKLKLLPVGGYGTLANLVMPSVVLAAGMAGLTARLLRASLLEVLQQDYIRAAVANGLSNSKILWKYALKNALLPVVTVIGLRVGMLLSGTVIIESIYGWPGLGKLMLDSIYTRDFPVVQGCVLVSAACFILLNTCVELIYAWLDPRIRWGTGR